MNLVWSNNSLNIPAYTCLRFFKKASGSVSASRNEYRLYINVIEQKNEYTPRWMYNYEDEVVK